MLLFQVLESLRDEFLENWKLLATIFAIQAFIGIAMVEYSYKMSRRCRKAPIEFLEEFPSFCRLDMKKWARWKFYPGAVTVLVPRVISIFTVVFLCGVLNYILYWGRPLDRPLTGIRLTL